MPYRNQSNQPFRPQFGGFSFFPPVIKYLLLANVGIFLIQMTLEGGFLTFHGEPLYNWFARTFYLWPLGSGNFMPWQLISYMFLHGGFQHVFFNMLMLWMFGVEIENLWGSKKFAIFYFAAGIAAGLANLLIAPLFTGTGPTIGASGGVYGIMAAFAMVFPDRYVYLYFLLPIRAKYLIAGLIILEVVYGVLGTHEGIAHVAHLGGAVVGGIWVLLDQRGYIDRWLNRKSGSTVSTRWNQSQKDAKFYEFTPGKLDRKSGDHTYDAAQQRIDEILDKISVSGYAGLTEEEKHILLDASKRIHPDRNNN
ncbi:MAG: rhomboid family intramembrane serine protease [Bacteroidetes bacterium]|nr:rhomboid family intramembrane serine protease [Bacteroidota bacterium]